jgi:hypothetical protein
MVKEVPPETQTKQEKFCRECNTTKPVSEFPRDKKHSDGYYTYCKTCMSVKAKAWYAKNGEDHLEKTKRVNKQVRQIVKLLQSKYNGASLDELILVLEGNIQSKKKCGIDILTTCIYAHPIVS